MPSTHSKPVQKKNAETTNPLRKYEKKLRNAKTEEQRRHAERMIRIHTPKENKGKKPKKPELTENQLLDQMVRESKKLRKNPEFIQQQKQTELKRQQLDEERQLTRQKIKDGVKQRKEKEKEENKKRIEKYEQYKQNEAVLNEHLESHKQFLTEFSENTGIMKILLEKYNGNENKAKKEYKKQTINMTRFFERMIIGICKEKEIPYDEARKLYYDTIRMSTEQNPTNDLLQLTASL